MKVPDMCRHCGDHTEIYDDPAPDLCITCAKAGRVSGTNVDARDLVGIAELASIIGVRRQAVCNWPIRHADFPRPVAALASGPVYLRSEVIAWHEGRRR